MKKTIFVWVAVLLSCACKQQENPAVTPFNEPPQWAQTAIWYQIFVERFENGDPSNDPTLETIKGSWPDNKPTNWQPSAWTSDWHTNEYPEIPFYRTVQMRRYGGDLQGLINRLDYLQDLGVTALYINPINNSPSLHKYDPSSYHHVDVTFGPDPEGDIALMAMEDPADPATWKWTAADRLFLELIRMAKERNLKIILDYSWNHTGTEFWAWKDILKHQGASAYKDWFMIRSFDDPATPENEFEYDGWAGVKSMPELKKIDVVNRRHGHPYEGNLQEEVKRHVFAVTQRWLAPDGDTSKGIAGYRLDVADQLPMGFWRDYRMFVRSVQPNALLMGEIWWQSWPDTLMDPRPYVQGDVFDIVMHYQQYKPARSFFAKAAGYGGAEGLQKELETVFNGLSEKTARSMMHMSSSHDAPRLSTSFYNKGKYKYNAKPQDDPLYRTGQPDEETMKRVKLYLAHQYTYLGAPQVWAGDEMGMWGSDDPDCRKPLWWPEKQFVNESSNPLSTDTVTYPVGFDKELHRFYKKMIAMRKEHPVLSLGKVDYLQAAGDILVYRRSDGKAAIDVYFNNSTEDKTVKLVEKGTSIINNKFLDADLSMSPLSFEIIRVR